MHLKNHYQFQSKKSALSHQQLRVNVPSVRALRTVIDISENSHIFAGIKLLIVQGIGSAIIITQCNRYMAEEKF